MSTPHTMNICVALVSVNEGENCLQNVSESESQVTRVLGTTESIRIVMLIETMTP